MTWAAGTTETFIELNLEYHDQTPKGVFKQSLLLAGTGVDTTALTAAAVAAFITHLEVVSNCAVTKAELRDIVLTPFANSAPKGPANTEYPSVSDVAELPYMWQNPLIPSKQVTRTVGIPAPVAGKLTGTGANAGVYSGTDADSIAVQAFLANYLVMKYPGNGLYYGGSVSPIPTFEQADFAVVSIPRIVQ